MCPMCGSLIPSCGSRRQRGTPPSWTDGLDEAIAKRSLQGEEGEADEEGKGHYSDPEHHQHPEVGVRQKAPDTGQSLRLKDRRYLEEKVH